MKISILEPIAHVWRCRKNLYNKFGKKNLYEEGLIVKTTLDTFFQNIVFDTLFDLILLPQCSKRCSKTDQIHSSLSDIIFDRCLARLGPHFGAIVASKMCPEMVTKTPPIQPDTPQFNGTGQSSTARGTSSTARGPRNRRFR